MKKNRFYHNILLVCFMVFLFPARLMNFYSWSSPENSWLEIESLQNEVEEVNAHRELNFHSLLRSSPTVSEGYKEPASSIKLQTLVDGLVFPAGIYSAEDGSGRLFLVQQTGEILIYNGSELLPDPFLDISSNVSCCGERGLLGLAFHPDYSNNGNFYVYYTYDTGDSDHPESRISRYSVSADPDQADQTSETVILSFTQPYANHNGGQLHFGPDGYLYLGSGDGGSSGDPGNRSQTLDNYFGKILRIDVDGGTPYTIPLDNPYLEDPDNPETLGEIWASGLRNPWRFSFDRLTGDMYIGDVGQSSWEEIDFESSTSSGGLNFGWRCYEGNHDYNTTGCSSIDEYDFPILEYDHTLGSAVTGGYVYRGNTLTFLEGKYIFGDYGSGRIWVGEDQGGGIWNDRLLLDTPYQISSFGEDQNGELYLTHYHPTNGKVMKIVASDTFADFDGDGDTDISVFRPSNGKWYISGESSVWWGLAGDIPVPGDYDGDGSATPAVFRPSNGKWYVFGDSPVWWGFSDDVPVQGDYDGDGTTDLAVFRPSNGKWYVYGESPVWWGFSDDIPVPGDYDGDGDKDIAVYRPSNGKWYIYGKSPVWWGLSGDIPVPGDYDGDGSTDIAVYRPSNGKWYVYGDSPVWWGLSGDIPVPGDYDGDGSTDIAVLRPSNGKWYIKDQMNLWYYLPDDYPLPVRDTNADGDPYH